LAKTIIIYGAKDCPWCDKVKDLLEDMKIKKFKFLDVKKDFKARAEMIKKSGQFSIPIVEVEGKIILGYNKEEIESAVTQ